jgi:hypothetical protein
MYDNSDVARVIGWFNSLALGYNHDHCATDFWVGAVLLRKRVFCAVLNTLNHDMRLRVFLTSGHPHHELITKE